ncbi:MAG: P-II family nitrogen regulator [Phycisphaerae bacterium]|nr:P-II family nitrogen regulator [Phycisphaerae bacterium]
MKEIKAIIRPHMSTKVMEALHGMPHFPGVTVSDCQGQGRGCGTGGRYEATEETIYFAKMTKLELFCADDVCDGIVDVIRQAARTGSPDDGVIAVIDLSRVVSIRTGEEQEKAV